MGVEYFAINQIYIYGLIHSIHIYYTRLYTISCLFRWRAVRKETLICLRRVALLV